MLTNGCTYFVSLVSMECCMRRENVKKIFYECYSIKLRETTKTFSKQILYLFCSIMKWMNIVYRNLLFILILSLHPSLFIQKFVDLKNNSLYGEFTFVGKGESVIDYALTDEKTKPLLAILLIFVFYDQTCSRCSVISILLTLKKNIIECF